MLKYRRRSAAQYVTDGLGTPVSDRTLEALPIPYQVIGGKALYDQGDLDAYIAEQLSAPQRVKGKQVAADASEDAA